MRQWGRLRASYLPTTCLRSRHLPAIAHGASSTPRQSLANAPSATLSPPPCVGHPPQARPVLSPPCRMTASAHATMTAFPTPRTAASSTSPAGHSARCSPDSPSKNWKWPRGRQGGRREGGERGVFWLAEWNLPLAHFHMPAASLCGLKGFGRKEGQGAGDRGQAARAGVRVRGRERGGGGWRGRVALGIPSRQPGTTAHGCPRARPLPSPSLPSLPTPASGMATSQQGALEAEKKRR